MWAGTGRTWDPEGLLSTLPAIGTVLFGVWTGQLLAENSDHSTKVARLMVRGAVLLGIGYVWNWFFPINKVFKGTESTVEHLGLDRELTPGNRHEILLRAPVDCGRADAVVVSMFQPTHILANATAFSSPSLETREALAAYRQASEQGAAHS